jgi:predicted  nucleic acid-binding Zn-ribbon protein
MKQEEIDNIQLNISMYSTKKEDNYKYIHKQLNTKHDELQKLLFEKEELENHNKNLSNSLKDLKDIFEKNSYDYKLEIHKKNEEIYILKKNYDKMVKDVIIFINL